MRISLALLLVVALSAAGLVGSAVVRGDGAGGGEVGGDDSSDANPWPAELRPYVDIVEDERDLDFEHPVPVEFLSPADFRRDVTAEKEDLSDDEREEIKQATSMLRAVGLIEGKLDLFEASNDLAGAGVIGYYSYKDEKIRIRGATLTAAAKSTLVHELTHALQDQHFDLGKRQKQYEKDDDSAGGTAFDALVEGDASRIETAYRESLSDDERAELDEEEASRTETYEENITEIPEILQTFAGAPYALGEAMLDLAIAIDGNDAVDALFRDPPTTEEHLLDPWTLLEDDDAALDVRKPKLPAGKKELDSGPFGALTWFLLLAERLPLADAFDAADGWGGDSYIAFERAGGTCVRINDISDSAADRVQMQDALHAWIAALRHWTMVVAPSTTDAGCSRREQAPNESPLCGDMKIAVAGVLRRLCGHRLHHPAAVASSTGRPSSATWSTTCAAPCTRVRSNSSGTPSQRPEVLAVATQRGGDPDGSARSRILMPSYDLLASATDYPASGDLGRDDSDEHRSNSRRPRHRTTSVGQLGQLVGIVDHVARSDGQHAPARPGRRIDVVGLHRQRGTVRHPGECGVGSGAEDHGAVDHGDGDRHDLRAAGLTPGDAGHQTGCQQLHAGGRGELHEVVALVGVRWPGSLVHPLLIRRQRKRRT